MTPRESRRLLEELGALPGAEREGFFGPQSASWRVNRESAVFLGAGRAALLQLAHPWVAAALGHHSNLLNDALGRFHSTFRVVYTMLFGTRIEASAASAALYRRHISIRGELPGQVGDHHAGEHYEANEVAALRWVYATLVDSALLAYEFALPPLSPSDREHYYSESKRMGALFGIPPDALPATWAAFSEYMHAMLHSSSLGVDAYARALAGSVLTGAGTAIRPPHFYHALTAMWLPEELRSGFGLPFGAREEEAVARTRRWLPGVYRRLPGIVRYVGPFHEGEARLRGRGAGPLIRANTRFWTGEWLLLASSKAR